jgi:hypothetical protein
LRTINDLENYYEANEGEFSMGLEGVETETAQQEMTIKVALRLRKDLMEK